MSQIDNPLYDDRNPVGLPATQIGPAVEFDPELTTEDEDGSVTVMTEEEGFEGELLDVGHDANLATQMSEKDLDLLATDLIEGYDSDKKSRSAWEKTYVLGLDLLGLKFEDRTEPWDGACGVFHPMLSEAVIRFQAQTIQEIFPAAGPVKVTVVGKESVEKTKQAKRVQSYMNYVCTKKMKEYRNETERLLFSLPIAGSAFRKVYHQESLKRPTSMFVPAEDFVVQYGASDLSTCERYTHVMRWSPNKVKKEQVSGFFRMLEEDLPVSPPDPSEIQKKYDQMTGSEEVYDWDDRHQLLEMHVDYDLAGYEDPDGILLPYIITIDKQSSTVLSIRRNWYEDDPLRVKRIHFVHYQYLPALGFYGFGLVHMIGGLSKSATSLLRQLIDAGTLANLPGGLKSKGLRIKGDDSPIKPGEFRDVDIPGTSIKDNIAFLPYKEPSGVLYQLLTDIVNEGRRFASAADVKVADMNGEAPVGTTLAILEREMKVLSAVQARIHAAMGEEIGLIQGVITDFGPDEYPYEVEDGATIKSDFDDRVDVIPVSDPNAGTMAQRIMMYQAVLQLSATAPEIYNKPFLHRQMIEVLGVPEAEKIIPTEEDLQPMNPVSENMALITGKPVKAFIYQDHEAHIQAHMSGMQNPDLMELMQKHPNIKGIEATAAAHLAEHIAFLYYQKIEEELGVELPAPEENLPEDIELRLSRLVAPASAQLTGKAQQRKQAEENAKKQEDPIVQMAEKELVIKEESAKAKAVEGQEKIASNERINKEKIQLAREQMQQAGMLDGAKILLDATDKSSKAELADRSQTSKETVDGFRVGLEAARDVVNVSELKKDKGKPNESG